MIRFSPDWGNEMKTPEQDVPRTPEPEVPKTPEPERPRTPEARYETLADQQKLFEDIHEKLLYDTIEENLSNLIDVEAGVGETKEMKITLEKTMSFRFQVHPENSQAVREAVEGLKDHFERFSNTKSD
jgi:hypothetical protein